MDNDTLFHLIRTDWNRASDKYLAHLRRLRKVNLSLDKAKNNLLINSVSENKVLNLESVSALEKAKMILDDTQRQIETVKSYITRQESYKTLLTNQITQLESADSSAEDYIKTLDNLSLYLHELDWRVEDGTLMLSEIPDSFSQINLSIQKEEVRLKQDELLQTREDVRLELARLHDEISQQKNTLYY